MTIIEILNYLNTSIKTGFSDAVKSIKEANLKVVFPKVQKIDGRVDVKFPNIQKVDVSFPENQKVTVLNQVSLREVVAKLADIRNNLSDKGVEVKNFPKFPEKIEVTNFPDEKELDFSSLEKKLDSLNESIKKLPTKFPDFPKIPEVKIPTPKEIVFPKSFKVDNLEGLISNDPKKSVPVRLTDGKEFYKAIEEFYQQVSSAVTFTNSDNQKTSALVDADRHVQVDVLTSPPIEIDTSLLASKAKQLPDNHNVTVSNPVTTVAISNPTTNPETGLAKSTKQDSQITLETTLNTLVETLQELTTRLTAISATVANTQQLRVVQASVPSTAVTGPITSANSIAEKAVGGISYAEKMAITNLTAIQSNVNNCIGK